MSFTENAALPATRHWIHDHWRLFLIEGVALMLLGILAMLLPPLAGLASTILFGWLLLAAGILGLLSTWRARTAPAFSWSAISAVVALLAGFVLLVNPWAGLLTLTYVLAAYFLVDGVVVIVMALSHRTENSGRWEWMALNGVIDLILAAIIISGMPGDATWVLGLLIGIDLVFGGGSLIAMALATRSSAAV
jgi:uncharacterized membrane protein HdeD (DUF308 family)